MSDVVYLDNNATTRVDERVLSAMWPYFRDDYGNASSHNHQFGEIARKGVETARVQIAGLIRADAKEVIFTSGATEANNLAIKGAMYAAAGKGQLIINAAEHRSVLDPGKRLARQGYEVTVLPVDQYGSVPPEAIAEAIRPETVLVSVMLANNEVGTINNVAKIGEVCRSRGVLLHCDAVQALGKIPVDVSRLQVDLMSLSAHKVYGPKGVGALFVRSGSPRVLLEPLIEGGGHERHFRSGTLPVPLIVGFGKACRLALESFSEWTERTGLLRDQLEHHIRKLIPDAIFNGHSIFRLPGTLNVSLPGVDGTALMTSLKQIAVSSGSACTTAEPEPSHVLRAMGIPDALAKASLRFGIGPENTKEEIKIAYTELTSAVKRLRILAD